MELLLRGVTAAHIGLMAVTKRAAPLACGTARGCRRDAGNAIGFAGQLRSPLPHGLSGLTSQGLSLTCPPLRPWKRAHAPENVARLKPVFAALRGPRGARPLALNAPLLAGAGPRAAYPSTVAPARRQPAGAWWWCSWDRFGGAPWQVYDRSHGGRRTVSDRSPVAGHPLRARLESVDDWPMAIVTPRHLGASPSR